MTPMLLWKGLTWAMEQTERIYSPTFLLLFYLFLASSGGVVAVAVVVVVVVIVIATCFYRAC